MEPLKGQRLCHDVSATIICQSATPLRTGFRLFLYGTPVFARSVQDWLISCTKCLIFTHAVQDYAFFCTKQLILPVPLRFLESFLQTAEESTIFRLPQTVWPRIGHFFGQMIKISMFRQKIADISAPWLKTSEKVPVFRMRLRTSVRLCFIHDI